MSERALELTNMGQSDLQQKDRHRLQMEDPTSRLSRRMQTRYRKNWRASPFSHDRDWPYDIFLGSGAHECKPGRPGVLRCPHVFVRLSSQLSVYLLCLMKYSVSIRISTSCLPLSSLYLTYLYKYQLQMLLDHVYMRNYSRDIW